MALADIVESAHSNIHSYLSCGEVCIVECFLPVVRMCACVWVKCARECGVKCARACV